MDLHPITAESFAIIDAEIGEHAFPPAEYQIVRRVIHATADFEYQHLLRFEHGAIPAALAAIRAQTPVIVDVQMVKVGVAGSLGDHPLICALEAGIIPQAGQTRTEAGLLGLSARYPEAIYVIGNAPTALLALVEAIRAGRAHPALVVGVPVGFVQVIPAKKALASLAIPQIRVEGRKGGSPVAAAIVNALMALSTAAS
ncbi:precorrin-8X methylmutase [Gloeobacter violaceus]|uniref:Precorrin isomerase n=1 Tax=Gloeobacter violaceus (strain ATCC 29082 / PCC 7421) TaxID=251221 RepID=Q7NNM7_GLOVI|nr:precorrin-8X methylmutase [Gloeobacter violaceus]BAC88325.1 precorrin isomerase [Gloeobacter violaceus PCC 7421]